MLFVDSINSCFVSFEIASFGKKIEKLAVGEIIKPRN